MRTFSPLRRLHALARAFARETRGSVSIEFVIMMPLLFWAFMASYVFFDGYRQSAVNLKAAHTIGDLISRETNAITDEYIDSMQSLLQVLTRASSPVSLRVTVVRWDEGDGRYHVDWSEARGFASTLGNGDMAAIAARLPVMPDNERVILIETSNTFIPLFNVGLDNIDLDNFMFTRPRFAPQVVFQS